MLKWWRRRMDERALRVRASIDNNLPFTAEEMARLIRSGRHEDFCRLAAGFAKPARVKRSA